MFNLIYILKLKTDYFCVCVMIVLIVIKQYKNEEKNIEPTNILHTRIQIIQVQFF